MTLWTPSCWAPLSTGFPRQEYWSGMPFPSPGDLLNPGIEPRSPALQADSLPPGKPKVKALVTQSCPTLCDPMDCSPPGSSVHGIVQARILEWDAIPFLSRSSWPRDWTQVSCIASKFLSEPPGEPKEMGAWWGELVYRFEWWEITFLWGIALLSPIPHHLSTTHT